MFEIVLLFNVIRHTEFQEGLRFALTIAIPINIALIVSTLTGTIIPIVINLLKIDPAVASGPFITTVSDIITLSIYYSISLLILLPLF